MRAFKGNTTEAGLPPRFVGTAYDLVVKVYENLDAIMQMGTVLEHTADFLFYRFSVPGDLTGIDTFSGLDVNGRLMKIPAQPMVYVNGVRLADADLSVNPDGTILTLLSPAAPGDQIHVASFGYNADGTMFFDPLFANDAIVAMIDEITAKRDQVVAIQADVETSANGHLSTMNDLLVSVEQVARETDETAARVRLPLTNAGFESQRAGDTGAPYGWEMVVADSAAWAILGAGPTTPTDSLYGSQISFGAEAGMPGPWWYISKMFRVSGETGLSVELRYWSAGFLGSPGAAANSDGFLDTNDLLLELVSYDLDGAVLNTVTGPTLSRQIWRDTGAKPADQTWLTKAMDVVQVHPAAAYAELRIVCANGSGGSNQAPSYQITAAGDHLGLLDDVLIHSHAGLPLLEIDRAMMDTMVSARDVATKTADLDAALAQAAADATAAGSSAADAQSAANQSNASAGQASGSAEAAAGSASAADAAQVLAGLHSAQARERARGNLIGKPTFEDGLLTGWDIYSGSLAVVPVPSAHPLGRTNALAQTQELAIYAPDADGWFDEDLAGRQFSVEGYTLNDGTDVAQIGIQAQLASDGSIQTYLVDVAPSGGVTWSKVSGTIAPIADTTTRWRPILRMAGTGSCYWTDTYLADTTERGLVSAISDAVAIKKAEVFGYSNDAATASSEALAHQGAAETAAANASSSETAAANSATAANLAKAAAETAQTASQAAKTASELARDDAQAAATSASGSATAAAGSASTAAASETAAGSSATAAQASETAAASSASDAANSATASAGSASAASTSATDAAQSASAASTSETNASTSEGNAALSASNAASSETNAAGSASSAASSATAAANSETAAGNSATAAAASASSASSSAADAQQSANASQTSATSAATSESNAGTYANQAAASATNAAGSESAAQNSATTAAEASGRSVALQGNPYFEFGKDGWKTYAGWQPDATAATNNAAGTINANGVYANKSICFNGMGTLHSGRFIPVDVNRTYRVKVRLRCLSTSGGPAVCFVGVATYDQNLTHQSTNPGTNRYGVIANYSLPNDDAWYEFEGDFTGTAATANSFRPGTAFVTVQALVGYNQSGISVEIDVLSIDDVTFDVSAAGSANAASSSASAAAASATDAGQSASAAQAAQTAAETARSGAQTAETNAAQSATDAASSASSASTSATNAANSETNAGSSASAASGSASAAATSANDAQTAATAANSSKVSAETASGQASASASSAASSATNAGTSANTAATSATVAARMSQGACVIDDPLFTDYATNWVTYATGPTLIANEVYPIGKTLKFVTNGTANYGAYVNGNAHWSGTKNADAYVVEIAFTLVSGSLDGAGILFDWWNDAGGNARTTVKLSDMVRETVTLGQVMTAQAVVEKGTLSGTFSYHRFYLMADYLTPRAQKELHIHAVRIRVATQEERGLGKVGAAVSAAVNQEAVARADADTALTNTVNSQQSSIDSMSATLTQQGTTLADINGNVSASYLLRAVAGQETAFVELTAYQDTSGGSASALKIKVDNLDLEGKLNADWIQAGNMSSNHLTVDSLLEINAATGALSAGKTNPGDSADGVTFGKYSGVFGFAAGRTNNGKLQELLITPETGLRIRNARHLVRAPFTMAKSRVTTSQTFALPAGTKSITLAILGGGSGGGRGRDESPSNDGGTNGAAGGNTVVELYDNGAPTGISWTANGGAAQAGWYSSASGQAGANSPYGTGGKGGYSNKYKSSDQWYIDYYGPGAASGYGAGGGGGFSAVQGYYGDGYTGTGYGGAGGNAGQLTTVNDFDVSGYANPSLVVTIGAGGAGGVPQTVYGTNHVAGASPSNKGKATGTAGTQGLVDITPSGVADTPADVIPLLPTAVGSFSKASGATGAVFPDLGPGMYVIYQAGPLNLGDVTINSRGDVNYVVGTNFAILICDQTPTILNGYGAASTVYYKFYSMSQWG